MHYSTETERTWKTEEPSLQAPWEGPEHRSSLAYPTSAPLVPWPRLWRHLRAQQSHLRLTNEVDVPRLEERLCRVEPILTVPRLSRARLEVRPRILIDAASRNMPFWFDQDQPWDAREGAALPLSPEGLEGRAEALPSLVSPANRVELGLLRAARGLLPPGSAGHDQQTLAGVAGIGRDCRAPQGRLSIAAKTHSALAGQTGTHLDARGGQPRRGSRTHQPYGSMRHQLCSNTSYRFCVARGARSEPCAGTWMGPSGRKC